MPASPQIVAEQLHVPESPRWRDDGLWFVDGPTIRRLDSQGQCAVVAMADCPLLLGMAFLPDGGVLTNDVAGRRVLKVTVEGRVEIVHDLSSFCATMLNEVHRFPDGSLLVGEFGFDILQDEEPVAQRLVLISPNGQVRRHGPEIGFANGMASIGGGRAVLVAEYVGGAVWRFEQGADGRIDEGRRIASGIGTGVDGIAVAPDGSIWFASMPEGYLARLDAAGHIAEKLETGFGHATSLAFDPSGGAVYATVLENMPTPETMGQADGAVVRLALAA